MTLAHDLREHILKQKTIIRFKKYMQSSEVTDRVKFVLKIQRKVLEKALNNLKHFFTRQNKAKA
jgi:hypothetical protein